MRQMIAALGMVLAMLPGVEVVRAAAASTQDSEQKTATCTLQVKGMTWAGCAAAETIAAKKIDGVKEVTVSLDKGTAEIRYDPTKTNPEAMAKTITDKTGFKTSVPKKTAK